MTLSASKTLVVALGFLTASVFTASAATIFNFSATVFGEGGFTGSLSGTLTIDTTTGTVDPWNIGSPDFAAWTGTPLRGDTELFTTLEGENSALETLVLSFEEPFDFVGFTGPYAGGGSILGFSVFSEHCSEGCRLDFTVALSEVPLPGALPLFATGLGALGLLGWRRKRKAVRSSQSHTH
jgi:hypothetical protein